MTGATDQMMRAGPSPARAGLGLVLLHGRGGDAAGMLGLAEALALPDAALVAPQAPGQSWWPTSFLAPAEQMAPWLALGLAAAEAAVQALQDDGLSRDRIAVLGFSQGGCLALEFGARSGAGLRAVIGLSAGLVGQGDSGGPTDDALYGYSDKHLTYNTDLTGVSVVIGCHARDPHIPRKRVEDSARVFETLGAEVQCTLHPGAGHGVTQADVTAVRRVLNTG